MFNLFLVLMLIFLIAMSFENTDKDLERMWNNFKHDTKSLYKRYVENTLKNESLVLNSLLAIIVLLSVIYFIIILIVY